MTAAIYTNPATTAMTAFTTLLNSGTLAIYTGAQPAANAALTGTQIVALPLSATAFAAPTTTGSGTLRCFRRLRTPSPRGLRRLRTRRAISPCSGRRGPRWRPGPVLRPGGT